MDYEHILLQKKGVKVYNIPPMTSNKGHFLDSWKNKITELNLKIVGKGHKCTVYLNNYDGTLFAAAPIPDNYEQGVVKCVDSSRGFALRVQDPTGKSAWIGIGFTERNDSFDFQACFQDFEKNRDMDLHPEKYKIDSGPSDAFSLKKGEKIVFNVAGAGANTNKPKTFTGDFKLAPPPGSGSFGLPPPPGSNSFSGAQPQAQPTQSSGNSNTGFSNNSNNNNNFNNFGDFGSFGSFNNNSSQNQNQNQNQGFGGFGGFQGSGQTQQSNQNSANNFDLLGDINFSAQPTTNSSYPNQQSNNNTQGGGNTFDLL